MSTRRLLKELRRREGQGTFFLGRPCRAILKVTHTRGERGGRKGGPWLPNPPVAFHSFSFFSPNCPASLGNLMDRLTRLLQFVACHIGDWLRSDRQDSGVAVTHSGHVFVNLDLALQNSAFRAECRHAEKAMMERKSPIPRPSIPDNFLN